MTDWDERIVAISVHPDSATRDEIALLAADLMEARYERNQARYHARVLAMAWIDDCWPPADTVKAARGYAVDQR